MLMMTIIKGVYYYTILVVSGSQQNSMHVTLISTRLKKKAGASLNMTCGNCLRMSIVARYLRKRPGFVEWLGIFSPVHTFLVF